MTPEPELIAAALAFRDRWTPARCKAKGYADWTDALDHAWQAGWDDKEPEGWLLRRLRNSGGPMWLLDFKEPT